MTNHRPIIISGIYFSERIYDVEAFYFYSLGPACILEFGTMFLADFAFKKVENPRFKIFIENYNKTSFCDLLGRRFKSHKGILVDKEI